MYCSIVNVCAYVFICNVQGVHADIYRYTVCSSYVSVCLLICMDVRLVDVDAVYVYKA